MKKTSLSLLCILSLVAAQGAAQAQTSSVKDVTQEILAKEKADGSKATTKAPGAKLEGKETARLKNAGDKAGDKEATKETGSKDASKALTSNKSDEAEGSSCGAFRATKAEYDIAVKELKDADRILADAQKRIRSSWNKGIVALSIGIPVGLITATGCKFYSKVVAQSIEDGVFDNKGLILQTVYGLTIGFSIAVITITAKDLALEYGVLGDLKTAKKNQLADTERLKRNVESLMANNNCH